ncbi:MAG: ABC transporter ATP-binding protein [Oscillospiraceae bacterium]
MQLEAVNLGFCYRRGAPFVLRQVSFALAQGQRLGLLAPSGYGKTTLAKLLEGYLAPAEGQILLGGAPLPPKGPLAVQLVGQHPEHAVNPRWKMHQVLEEAGQLQPDVLQGLGIETAWLGRYPAELSGGELQRFCVARALGPHTRFLIADEISTMLDAVTQAQIWHYLLAQAGKRGLGLLVITHSEALAQQVCSDMLDLQGLNHAAP